MSAASSIVLASAASDAASKFLSVIETVGGFLAIMAVVFFVAGRATGRLQKPVAAIVCLAPAILLLIVGLVVPAVLTIYNSLHNTQYVGTNGKFVGLRNYKFAFTDPDTQAVLLRTMWWLLIVPAGATIAGLVMALMVDRMRLSSVPKSLVFLPTAISFVGASIIWAYVYNYVQPSDPQTGLLSAVVIKLGWKNPPHWLLSIPLNTFLLMIIMIWIQAGLAMIILGAALKAIPDEILEAARMDGATGFRLFRTVQIPMIRSTLIVVVTTITIATLKVFDIVYTVTGGTSNTDVLSSRLYKLIFIQNQVGRGSALAVILFLAVTPLIVYNIVMLRKERATR